jgi:hypothetical protein
MRCLNGHDVRDSERFCPVCHADCGYPNVRAAEQGVEKYALAERLRSAEDAAKARGCERVLAEFREAVRSSKAVVCGSLHRVMALVSSENALYASFYQLVGLGARRPEDTEVERERLIADDLLFPYYQEEIRFAALSLTGRGVGSYGDCSLTLRESAIHDRTTVFEENSLYFCKQRKLGFGKPVPPGYRAVWDERDMLSAAKLESSLQPGTQSSDFPEILLKTAAKGGEPDFVEAHIYGSLHRLTVEHLVMTEARRKSNQPLIKHIEKEFKAIGCIVEVHR